MNRRHYLKAAGMAGVSLALGRHGLAFGMDDRASRSRAPFGQDDGRFGRVVRTFHLCLAPDVVVGDPELLRTVRQAGVGTVWLAGFLYGHRPYSDELLRRARGEVERAGMRAQLITVPLGHPGNSLGKPDGNTPPAHWAMAQRPDGQLYSGTSLHPPATAENSEALRRLRGMGFRECFVDDDFRLARSPGEIGGCFCATHRERFLRLAGYPARSWEALCDDVRSRRLTPLLRSWLEFTGDELSESFRLQRGAFRGGLGIMVMYLGAEKAGIRLRDYRAVPFRVGELMFDDGSFGTPKGKTDELFSVLFHRRFARPERAYSETTAYPADRLSAANMASKLVISTLADVRHTMLMSGLTPFPREHWSVLGPAMRRQATCHAALAGHVPRGPFKHFWGEAQRLVGDDRPFSLWLALGIPFEVVDRPPADGWTFLSDFDAREWGWVSRLSSPAARWVCRASAAVTPPGAVKLGESLAELWAWKRQIRGQLREVPHVAEDHPAVCAWYPSAGQVAVWNLLAEARELTVIHGASQHALRLGPLEMGLVAVGGKWK
ncbi:MAG: hypothetical protein IT580_18480 [Verrucomicrobiales bacterium]|nr:hypothetical protein [Verrucomicrobiales bacterium]